ncbi:hypothetical protein [Burkholderia gladioli]|uniref:hypothetical protein n=1 Tax=Burkholderia gladioli TaxID=28095 RepID=UPI001C26792C|nr:hypothetical protein [Burkholderia gladioli]MBU9385106.1 hypothetical protein [Burkholderia gladioli]
MRSRTDCAGRSRYSPISFVDHSAFSNGTVAFSRRSSSDTICSTRSDTLAGKPLGSVLASPDSKLFSVFMAPRILAGAMRGL